MTESVWTLDSLKQYVDQRLTDQHREHDKYEDAVNLSLSKQNEFRGALEDLGRTMATRREFEVLDDKYNLRLGRVESMQARIAGSLIFLAAILMPAVVVITFILAR